VPYRTNRKRKVIYRLIFSITKEVLVAARIQFGSTFLFINISLKSSIELGYGVSGNKSDNKSKMVTAGAHACECVIIVAELILSLSFLTTSYKQEYIWFISHLSFII
jgi:hypothetical protein